MFYDLSEKEKGSEFIHSSALFFFMY